MTVRRRGPPAPFVNPQPVTIVGYSGSAMEPFITRNEGALLFNSGEPNKRIYYAAKGSDTAFAFQGEIANVNTATTQGGPSLDGAGHLYFTTDRSLATDHRAIYRGFWGWALAPVVGLLKAPDGWYNMDGEISADGALFVFSDNNMGRDPMVSTLAMASLNPDGSFTRLPDMMGNINTPGAVSYAPSLSADRLELFFTRMVHVNGMDLPQLFTAMRSAAGEPFKPPQHVEAAVGFVEGPSLSADGHRLYYHRCQPAKKCSIFMLTR